MQIKTKMRYHLKPVRMSVIQKTSNNKCYLDYGGENPSAPFGCVNWCSCYGKQYAGKKKEKMTSRYENKFPIALRNQINERGC